jgi:hypothetical protein
MNRISAVAVGLICAAAALSLPACMKSPSAPANTACAADAAKAAQSNAARETWDACFLQGGRVGYVHTTARPGVDGQREIVATEMLQHLSINRAGQTSTQEIHGTSVETPAGRLIRFESELRMGTNPIRTTGSVHGDRLDIETTAAGQTTPNRASIPWSSDCGGPFATEQSVLRQPMRPGEHRAIKALVLGFNQIADVEMIAKDYEPTKLRTGTYDLLRIEAVTRFSDGQKLDETVWTDRTGDTLKARIQAMDMEVYRTSKADALEEVDAVGPDLFSSMMVKVDRPVPHPHQTRQVRYRVHLEGGDPASVFAAGPTQAVKSLDDHTAEITVYAIRPGRPDGNPNAPADPPGDDDLRPNTFIQSDDPTIVADAEKAVGGQKDPWQAAMALESYVNREVKYKDYTQAFATAAEVAKSHEGDCTEHAVFLAALARAQNIPARVAVGLVYLESKQAFFYHMWTEVYIDKRWVPIDGTLARGGIGGGHLKIAQSNLKSAFSAFLPVMQVAGRLRIEVLDSH